MRVASGKAVSFLVAAKNQTQLFLSFANVVFHKINLLFKDNINNMTTN
jgi:hypothetical protein